MSAQIGLQQYQRWLSAGAGAGARAPYVRGIGEPSSQEVCINYLLTHNDFSGSTVGLLIDILHKNVYNITFNKIFTVRHKFILICVKPI